MRKPDYGAMVADTVTDEITKRVHGVYQQASKRLQKKLGEFTKRFAGQDAEKRKLLEEKKITLVEYNSWRDRQIFRQKQWQDKLDQATRIMNDANSEAAEIVRKGKLNVFAENYNFEAYKIEKASGISTFNLYNEKSAARLIRKKPKLLPEWKINEKKDYKWNRKKVNNTITQGIIQGKDIREITKDLTANLCAQNENKMRTFARTAMTGAQNAGRLAQMEDAEDMGIKVKKRWVAVLDNRTRDAHGDLDGQEVDVNEPFRVMVDGQWMEIDFPGDPSADPCMVYNCRCSMIEVYEGIDRKSVRRDMDNNLVENMTYNEWKKMKEGK